jgi:two-component system, chemotaxis family, protein-glutamate methylesterase/glutaminase
MTAARRPRVLICEDSRTYAAALRRVIEYGGTLEVIAVSGSAEEAIAAAERLSPDLITMDIELPGMSGLKAVERIMSAAPAPILVLSGSVGPDSQASAAALAAGALDAVPKGSLDLLDPAGAGAIAFRRRLVMMSGIRVIRHPRGRQQVPIVRVGGATRSARAIGICSSMGGPHALLELLGALPRSFPLPILIAQHITVGFAEGLARWLDSSVPLPVHIACAGERVERGVWLAPDDAHMLLDSSGKLALRKGTPADRNVPSGDELLRSLASRLGPDAVSVVLTGMGRDGAEGTAAVRAAGGLTIAQDEATSAIFGMPRAAAERGVDRVLPLTEIAAELCNLRSRVVAA